METWETCKETYDGSANDRKLIWKDQLCTSAEKTESVCPGDEGGPVMFTIKEMNKCECTQGPRVEVRELGGFTNEITYLMGVIIFPFQCVYRDTRPNINTQTKFYLKFILDNIKP